MFLRPGGFPRLLPFYCDSGSTYVHSDPFYSSGAYYGYILPTNADSKRWPGHFMRVTPLTVDPKVGPENPHPVLWHFGMWNACSNFPIPYARSRSGLYWYPPNSRQWVSEGQFTSSPRSISFVGPTVVAPFFRHHFGWNTDVLDKYGIMVTETLMYGGQWVDNIVYAYPWNGWLDCHLPRDDVQHLSLDGGGGSFACFTTDNTKYTGGDVYEIVESYCTADLLEYWFTGTLPADPPVFGIEGIKNFKMTQQQAKAKVCNKYRSQCIQFHDRTARIDGVAPFPDAYWVQKQHNQAIVSALGNQWQLTFNDTVLIPVLVEGTFLLPIWQQQAVFDTLNKVVTDMEVFFGMKKGEMYIGWEDAYLNQ